MPRRPAGADNDQIGRLLILFMTTSAHRQKAHTGVVLVERLVRSEEHSVVHKKAVPHTEIRDTI